ncbi:MAG: 23S rRNA (guanosine(2251)-2'-O)-methyltransferase RlmB [Gammaproteobacteria bacterium]
MTTISYIYGVHAVAAVLRERPQEISVLHYLSQSSDKALHPLLKQGKQQGVRCEPMTRHELNDITNSGVHQGIVAQCPLPSTRSESDFFNAIAACDVMPFILVLDGIQDPHNLGACLRTAAAAGVQAVVVPQHNAVSLTPTVCKVAAGAAETVPLVVVSNLARTLKRLKKQSLWLYGLAGEAKESLYHCHFTGGVVLVLGAEGTGLRRLTAELCDYLLHIPMAGALSSVNVSVAAGISCFEVVRQRSSE